MPLYEYECNEHGKFDVLHNSPFADGALKIRDGVLTAGRAEVAVPKLAPCPKCKLPCKRVVAAHARTPGKWKV